MNEKQQFFTLDELASLVSLPRRTVRYYIQIDLVDRPEGVGRGAHYTTRHLEQLIEIRKWQQAGLSLERIGELLKAADSDDPLPPPRSASKGSIVVRSHVIVNEGVELTIDPSRSGLSPEQVRELASGVMKLYEKVRNTKEKNK